MSEETLPTEPTPEQPPVVEEVVAEQLVVEEVVAEQLVVEEVVAEQPPVVEEVVAEQPPVVEEVVEEVVVAEQVPTNEEILLNFGSLKSSQSCLIRRGALTTLSLDGNTDPSEQEINERLCVLYNQHKSWEALIELDSSFYR